MTLKNRVFIVGIDSMDSKLVNKYIDYLPTFKQLIDKSPDVKLKSVIPPDSDTAWASIYTGLNPAEHGIVNFVDPLEKASIYQADYLDISNIKGNTFWDIAGNYGKKVCLIYPPLAYPVWPVNGFMISPIHKTDGFQIYPPNFKFSFPTVKLKVPQTIPNSKSEYKDYLYKFRNILINEFEFARNMLVNYNWDLFFFFSCALDFIQHIFWNYCDPDDPTYPGDNPFKNVIRDFYVLHDKLVRGLIQDLNSDTTIMILSDHGHSMRPVKLFNINEVLRREGYLFSKKDNGSMSLLYYDIIERLKRSAVNAIQRTGMRRFSLSLLRNLPKLKEMYVIPASIDFNRTIAYCSDLSGIKSYTYGGIIISKTRLNEVEYLTVRNDIIKKLRNENLPNSGKKVFEWIYERERLYHGRYIHKYPDIVFKLIDDYGAGWGIKVPYFSETKVHSFFPGSHDGKNPIFILNNFDDDNLTTKELSLMDIHPLILKMIGINQKRESAS